MNMTGYIEKIKAGAMEGYELLLEINPDDFAHTSDDEGLTKKQIEAYESDEWSYVTATVSAVKHGITLGEATYGMLEYGDLPITDESDNLIEVKAITAKDIDNYVGTELAAEAISRAEEIIKKLREEN